MIKVKKKKKKEGKGRKQSPVTSFTEDNYTKLDKRREEKTSFYAVSALLCAAFRVSMCFILKYNACNIFCVIERESDDILNQET